MKGSFFIIPLLILYTVINAQQSPQFIEHVIKNDFNGACTIASADFDNDGDNDIVATSFNGNYISWFENDGSLNFTEHLIVNNFGEATVVDVAHIDNDDDFDIIATAQSDNKISWFDNDGSGNFTEHVITANYQSAGFVYARDQHRGIDLDINGDGFTDFIATGTEPGDKISWFENDGNQNFTEHLLKDNWYWVRRASAYDIDQDGDMDIFAGGKAGDLIWFENDGLNNFSENVIISDWGWLNAVLAEDVNKDGFIDIIATTVVVNEVAWFENDGNQNFTKHVVKDEYDGAFGLLVEDIDNDDDWDILATAWIGGFGSVFYNDGNQNFDEYVFCDTGNELLHLFTVDLDNDSDLDILGACYDQSLPELRWWENRLIFIECDFKTDLLNGNIPLQINFNDLSQSSSSIDEWEWDFNNDGIVDSYEQSPIWTYTEPGFESVSLTVKNAAGVSKITKQNLLHIFNGQTSLKFSSSIDYAETPQAEMLNLTDNFTIEIYIYPDGASVSPQGATIIDKDYLNIYIPRLGLGGTNKNAVVVEYINQNDEMIRVQTPSNTVQKNIWQQIAVSFNFTLNTISIYINGSQQDVSYSTGNSFDTAIKDNSSLPFYLGNDFDEQMSFNGLLDEFRIWNFSKTHEQILEHLNSAPDPAASGLLLYYNMNEGNGSILTDLTSNNYNGTVHNCAYWEGIDLSSISGVCNNFDSSTPNDIMLYQNYPNPFNPLTIISFYLPEYSNVQLKIFDLLGNEISTLVNGMEKPGFHQIKFDGSCLSSGVYFYTLKTENRLIPAKKLILIK